MVATMKKLAEIATCHRSSMRCRPARTVVTPAAPSAITRADVERAGQLNRRFEAEYQQREDQ